LDAAAKKVIEAELVVTIRCAFDVADANDEARAVIVTGTGRRMTGAGCQARAAAPWRPWNRRRVYGDDRSCRMSWMVTA
jgi:enoyl-CoA hydratase/carnithine racemase